MQLSFLRKYIVLVLILFLSSGVEAEGPSDDIPNSVKSVNGEFDAALHEMQDARKYGPLDIPCLNQAVLHLPQGYAYVPNPAASRFMIAIGNHVNEDFLGLVLPAASDEDWVASLAFEKSGYIKDEDARNWNIDDIFKSIQEGVTQNNRDRESHGMPELEVLGWARCRITISLTIDWYGP